MPAGTAWAQDTVYWKGGASSAWDNPANWTNDMDSTSVLPGPGTNVVIDNRYGVPANMPLLNLSPGGATIGGLVVSGMTAVMTLSVTNGDVSTRVLTVQGDMFIGTNGVLTHAADWSTSSTVGSESNRLCMVVGGNLTINQGGQINVDYKGYAGGRGPGRGLNSNGGASAGGNGGGYGGEGSAIPGGNSGGTTYGSITNPVNNGSGGYNFSYCAGGGAVVLRVNGTLTNNGTISANGRYTENGGGGGAGGSINVLAGAIAGATGRISASGGNGRFTNGEGAGGGGRIALVVTNAEAIIPTSVLTNVFAVGGASTDSSRYAAAGTIYLKTPTNTWGDLIVNNTNVNATVARTLLRDVTYRFDSITTTNLGVLLVGTNAALTLDGCVLRNDSSGSRLVVQDNGQLNWTGTWTNNGTISWRGTNRTSGLSVGSLVIATNAVLTHETTDRPTNCLTLAVNGDLTVDAGGSIWVAGCGYGAGLPYTGGSGYGGVHGGQGGSTNVTTYGSVTNPITAGGGGGQSAGGGVAIIRASGDMTVNGVVSAQGSDAGNMGGSAGGSVNIQAGRLLGSGSITVKGGNGIFSSGGRGGGGGRIAVVLTNAATFGNVAISAVGGAKNTGPQGGAAGTIYLKGTNLAYGLLIVSNNVALADTVGIRTLISTQVTDAVAGDVQLLNTAQFAVDSSRTLTVYGGWSNAAATNAISGGTVEFAGTSPNPVSVWGGNTWSNLTIATAGKTVQFEAGKTQFVYGVAAFSNVTLQSTSEGAYWYLLKPDVGTQYVGRVTVQDSNATNGWTFAASGGSGRNTVNWRFPPSGSLILVW